MIGRHGRGGASLSQAFSDGVGVGSQGLCSLSGLVGDGGLGLHKTGKITGQASKFLHIVRSDWVVKSVVWVEVGRRRCDAMWLLSKSKWRLDEGVEVWLQVLLESGEVRKLGGVWMMVVMRNCDGT